MNRTSATSGLIVILLLITGIAGSVQALDLSGRCYSGQKPDESSELQGVPVTLYGAPEEGGARTQLDADTTDSNGWYGLTVQEGYEYYFIVAGSVSDYSFNGASSVSGTVSGNEIHYSTISAPLSEQTLTGNKFWYTSDTPQNNPPVANDDSSTTAQDKAVDIDVLSNDSDPDGDPLHINSATDPPHGTTTNHGSHVTYTPDPGFTGTDSFDYTTGDGKGGTDTATVTVTVEEGPGPENNPPMATDDSANTAQDKAVDIDVLSNDSDPDGDPLHINSATNPPNGTTINHGTHITYTPNPGFTGTDTFDYTVGDGKGGTDTATVTVTVEEGPGPENNPPVADADGLYTGQVGQPITLDGSGSYDPDPGDSIVSYEWELDNDGQYDDATGVNPTWTWSVVGFYTIGLRVTDTFGETDTDQTSAIISEGEPETGTIIIEKQTEPDGATNIFDFSGDIAGSIRDGGQLSLSNIPPGTYTSQEIVPQGWMLIRIQLDDDNSSGDVATATATFRVEAGETVKAVFTNRKATSTPAPVTFPHGDWPTYAQDEISVHPEPPSAGSLTRLCAEVVNNDPVNAHVVTLEFRVANFGIGLPWNTVGSTSVHVPSGSIGSGCVVWTPPGPGHWCIEVVLHQDGAEPQHSQRNIDADEPLQPGEPHSLTFPVGNPFDHRVDITLGLVPHLDGWGFDLYPDTLLYIEPGEIREVTLTVTPPQGEPLPPDGTVIVDVEAYVEGELIGGFRKIFRPPVPLHRFADPSYAESEITVHPYPVRAGEPVEVCVELRNPTADPLDVMVQFSWANFGIGIPFTPINGLRPVHLPPHSIVKECIHWIPPVSGSVCIQVELHMEGYDPQYSQRNIDIDEPLQPGESHSLTFPVGNPLDHPVHITLGLVPHLPNWGLELYPDILLDMAPGEIREVTLTVTPPQDEPLPHDGTVIVDVEAYVESDLIGGFRKVFSPPVTVHRPKDPVYAETEIGVDPYPIVPGQPVKLSVELRNPTDTDQIVQTHFSVAPFGIGLPFNDEDIMPNPIHIFVPTHGAARGHVTWNPPPGLTGKFCVQVTLELEGHEPLWSRRCIDVGEPLRRGEPHSLTFPVGNPFDHRVDITLGLVPHLPNWGFELYPDILWDMAPGEIREVTLTVTPPLDEPLPPAGEVIVDVEAFVDGELIGGFRKLNVPPVSVHKLHEKSYAETEISVDPDPPQEGQETTVSAVLHNTGDVPVVVNVEFGWADFGMGIPFSNVGMVPPAQMATLAPSALTSVDASWTPTQSGHQCILIRLTDPEGQLAPQESQRNVHVAEPPPCGETKVFTFTIYNDSPSPVTVDLGLITFNVPSDWEVTTDPTGSVLVGPHDEVEIKVIVKIPCPPSLQVADILQRVGGGVPTIDVEGYINGVLKGGIQIQFGEIITVPVSPAKMGRIHYSKSNDGRATFEPGITIAEAPDGPAQINPDIGVDDQGIIHVVWEDYATHPSLGNIMYARSDDGGGSFGESVMVDDAVTVSTHQARPQIALDDDGIIHVVWEDYRRDPQLGDVYYSKSTDGGRTFNDDVLVDDPITVTSRQVNPDIVIDSRGDIHIVWEDYRDNVEMANIYYARSTDGGRTFGADKSLNEVFDHATHHGRPTIVADGSDTLYVFWEDYRNASHLGDIYCSLSTNGGETFASNVMVDDPITVTSRQIRPSAVVDGSGIVYVVWEDYRDDAERGNIYGARSVDGGKTFERDVMVDSPFTTSTHHANPAIAVTGGGLVQVVWEDYRDLSEHANIYYSASLDGGKTFSEDVPAGRPVSASGPRLNPAIAVSQNGVMHLVWQE